MMLIIALVFIVVAGLLAEHVYRALDRRGSDCWWWFENKHIAKSGVTAVLFSIGISIATFGHWIEIAIATTWFGWVVVGQMMELYSALRNDF